MCRLDQADGELVTSPHSVKARKAHRCSNCDRSILAGENYHTGTWAYDGSLSVVKYCEHCHLAAAWLDEVCAGYLWGDWQIIEDLAEHWDEEPDFRCRSFALLLAAMRRKWDGTSTAKVRSLTRYATAHALRQIGRAERAEAVMANA